jgi:hypothetical protein
MQAQASDSLVSRLMGIITFKTPVYKEVAEDKTATSMAAIIVVVVAVLVGLISGLISSGRSLVYTLVYTVIVQLISWAIGSWLLAFIAKQFFHGDTDTGEMLRVTGYTSIFQILGVIPVVGSIIGGLLQVVANVIGIREAAGFDTTKAILTVVIEWVIILVISGIIGAILALVLIGTSMVTP